MDTLIAHDTFWLHANIPWNEDYLNHPFELENLLCISFGMEKYLQNILWNGKTFTNHLEIFTVSIGNWIPF